MIEVAESSNELGLEANIGRKAHHADASGERGGERTWVEEKPCSPREEDKLHKQLQPTRHITPNMCGAREEEQRTQSEAIHTEKK